MTIIYRTTDLSKWGAGLGANLTAAQIDANFYELDAAIKSVAPVAGVGIASISVNGDQFTVNMTDNSIQGPFTMPTARLTSRGVWAANTPYAVNDIVTADGSVYVVAKAHTSGATWNAGANDGLGVNYYGLMFTAPDHQVSIGGTIGQVLTKTGSSDYIYAWRSPSYVPTGGNAREVLAKKTGAAFDFEWRAAAEIPAGGAAGAVLRKASATDFDAAWSSLGTVPAGGATGQVLTKTSSGDYALGWVNKSDLASLSDSISADYVLDSSVADIFRLFIGADLTLSVRSPISTRAITLIITGSAAAHTVTFASATMKSTGTLALAASALTTYVVTFVPYGGVYYETSRTTGMA